MTELNVKGVAETGGAFRALLVSDDGQMRLEVDLAPTEATQLRAYLADPDGPPLSHFTAVAVTAVLRAAITRVALVPARTDGLVAIVHVSAADGMSGSFTTTASAGIGVAVAAGLPVYAGAPGSPDDPDERVADFRRFLDAVDPADF
jgi:hypothetical protein